MIDTIDEFRGKHFFLSNFYTCSMTYNGLTYMSSEAAYQAQKTLEERERRYFLKLNAEESKKFGRSLNLRADWEDVKVSIMKEIVTAKFEQNEFLRQRLKETGTAYLIEGNTWGDTFWGKVDGEGENHLGLILMDVREELCHD